MVKRLAKYKRFALPETITSRLDTFRYVFNPSYLNKDDGNYLAIRAWDQNTDSMLALLFFWRPNEEPVEINLNELCKQHCGSEEVSDPKMFLMDGKVYCTYNTGHKRTVQNEIYLLELEETGVKSFKRMHYPERLMIEKNWAFFIHEGELHTIYSLDPFTILKAIEITDDEIVFERHWTSEAHAYKYFSIGTQCVRDKDELKFMAHKKIYKRGKRFYFGKAFRFDPSSPDAQNRQGFNDLFGNCHGLILRTYTTNDITFFNY